jgi:SPRY domain
VVPPVVFATWDPATITAVTLSGGNLVVTNTGTTSADQGAKVVAASGKTTGKFYFETTLTVRNAGGNCGIGIGTFASTYSTMGANATTGDVAFTGGGTIYANGAASAALSARGTGDVIGIAVDLDNRKIWFKTIAGQDPKGFWNNSSGTPDPVTNVGGVIIPAGTMVPFDVFGGASGVAGSVHTTNFGASAFVGAVPSGFTAGWPA